MQITFKGLVIKTEEEFAALIQVLKDLQKIYGANPSTHWENCFFNVFDLTPYLNEAATTTVGAFVRWLDQRYAEKPIESPFVRSNKQD